MKPLFLALPLAFALAPVPALAEVAPAPAAMAAAPAALYAPITRAEVEAAQQAWGQGLVAISVEYDSHGFAAAKALAEKVIDSAYGYDMGPVLFKPTLAKAPQAFRTTREGALSYFVGGNPAFPDDQGFALKHWRRTQVENAGIVITGNMAISMGNVSFWDDKGNMTRVDKTWGYVRGADGKLRIVLHHSSLPYSP